MSFASRRLDARSPAALSCRPGEPAMAQFLLTEAQRYSMSDAVPCNRRHPVGRRAPPRPRRGRGRDRPRTLVASDAELLRGATALLTARSACGQRSGSPRRAAADLCLAVSVGRLLISKILFARGREAGRHR